MNDFFNIEYNNSLEITNYDLALSILQSDGSVWQQVETNRFLLFDDNCYTHTMSFDMFSTLFRDGNIEEDEVEFADEVIVFIFPKLRKQPPACMQNYKDIPSV